MSHLTDLVPTLASLPQEEYAELIKQVDEERRRTAEQEIADKPPHAGMSRDEFAKWMARQHYAVDKGIVRIVYLPTDAPEMEVRLLEANALANLPEHGPVTAVDFMPDIEGLDYALYVADVTPAQYDSILQGRLAPPSGWNLCGAQEILPGQT